MLETNKYEHCLTIDFSKAFDSVDHLTLIQKLKGLNISNNKIQWVVSFLTDRSQLFILMKGGHLHKSLTTQSYKVLESGQHCLSFA